MERQLSASRAATLLGAFDTSPAYRGIAEGFRRLIADGRVPVGTRLPSERDLTTALGVSRTTVTRAYATLVELSYASARQGSGTVATLPASRGHRGDHLLSPADVPGDAIDLTCASSTAPAGVAQAYEAAVAELPTYLSGTGYYPTGLPALREAIARGYEARDLPTSPDQVIVTAGAQAGVAIAVRAVTSTGDRVLVEAPTYPNAIATLQRAGTRLAGVDVDGSGWDVESVVAAIRQVGPRAAYLIPDFHNPTGALAPAEAREQVAAGLRTARTTAIVDESLQALNLDGLEMPPPFAAFSPDTVTVGSASKAFWGGFRIGWVRAPEPRTAAVIASRLSLDLGAPVLEQLALLQLMNNADSVLTERRDALRLSRSAFTDALHRELPEWRVPVPAGGLCLWVELPEAVSSTLTAVAEQHDLLLASGPSFAPEGGFERYLRLPFTQAPDVLRAAVPKLRAAWDQTLTTAALRSPTRTLVA
ncbi:MAG: PLP-dependent aminotransferase family protein [Frankiales bacterium]|nr:PLP-dependent aminotransferase family protein [Frankiales bacterium]